MADDAEIDALRTETLTTIGEPVERGVLSMYGSKSGMRMFIHENEFIPAFYNGKKWKCPLYSSESYCTGQNFVGNHADYLTGADLALLAKKYNSYQRSEKGFSPFYKLAGSEIPDSLIRYFCQKKPESGMWTLLMVMKCSKVTPETRRGPNINIFTIFHVGRDNKIYTPTGLFHSKEQYDDVAEECNIVFSEFRAMSASDLTTFQGYKRIANEVRQSPGMQLTSEQHFQVFCLFHMMRSNDSKYSDAMLDMARYATNLTKMQSANNYTIMGGSFNELRVGFLNLLFAAPDAVNRGSELHRQTKNDFLDAYNNTFKTKKKRQSRKRTHAQANDDDDDDDEPLDSLKDDIQYYSLELDEHRIVRVENMWIQYINTEIEDRVPKTLEEYLDVVSTDDIERGVKLAAFQGEVQNLMAHEGKSAEDAHKRVLLDVTSKLRQQYDVRVRVDPGNKYVTDPLVTWARNHLEVAKKIMARTILSSLAMAANKTVAITRKITDADREEIFSRFFSPYNPQRVLASTEKAEVVTNVIMIERAMENNIRVILGEENGKSIALLFAILYRDMYPVINKLLRDNYQQLQRWAGEAILEMVFSEEDEDNCGLEFGTYYLPAILSAMILYISRRMYDRCEENKWFDWPANVICNETEREPFKKATKSNDMIRLEADLGNFNELYNAFGRHYDFDGITEESIEYTLRSRMIVGHRVHQAIPHLGGQGFAPTMIHICKVVNGDGRFGYKLINPLFPFSCYAIFSQCEHRIVTFTQKGHVEALDNHPMLSMIHTEVAGILEIIKRSKRDKVYDQVPVKQKLVSTAGGERTTWFDLQSNWEEMNEDTEVSNIVDIGGYSWSAITSADMDIAITCYLILAGAVRPPSLLSFPDFEQDVLSKLEAARTRGTAITAIQGKLRSTLTNLFEATGQSVLQYSMQFMNNTLIGRSIVDDTLRGIVFIGSIDTFLCSNSKVREEYKHLQQIAPLSNVFFKKENAENRVINMFSEMIILNPEIHGIQNAEPMTSVGWKETSEFMEAQEAARAAEAAKAAAAPKPAAAKAKGGKGAEGGVCLL